MSNPDRLMAFGLAAELAAELDRQLQAEPTDERRGGVLQQPSISDVGDAPSQSDFNGLLDALRDAGVLAKP